METYLKHVFNTIKKAYPHCLIYRNNDNINKCYFCIDIETDIDLTDDISEICKSIGNYWKVEEVNSINIKVKYYNLNNQNIEIDVKQFNRTKYLKELID